MKRLLLLGVSVLFCLQVNAWAGEPDLGFAFTQLKSNGAIPFARALYETEPESAKLLATRLGTLAKDAGEYMSYEIVSRKALTRKVERVIISVYFERCPVYLRIDYYDAPKGLIVLPALVSKEASEVLPFDVIAATGK